MKGLEDQLDRLLKDIKAKRVSDYQVLTWMETNLHDHAAEIRNTPPWVDALVAHLESQDNPWTTMGAAGRTAERGTSPLAIWASCEDLSHLEGLLKKHDFPEETLTPLPKSSLRNPYENLLHDAGLDNDMLATDDPFSDFTSSSDEEESNGEEDHPTSAPSDSGVSMNVAEEIASAEQSASQQRGVLFDPIYFRGLFGDIPLPKRSRPLEKLLADGAVWNMSQAERKTLLAYVRDQVWSDVSEDHLARFSAIRKSHEHARRLNEDQRMQVCFDSELIAAAVRM
jgi:hypothetical protein